jgi:hypothetical protein
MIAVKSRQKSEARRVDAASSPQNTSASNQGGPNTVKTLLGSSQLETAIKCISSLLWAYGDKVNLHIHDDGTLTKNDSDKLRHLFPRATIVSKQEADGLVYPLLANYPACAEYRRRHPLALKLFDICLLEKEDKPFFFCDSDVLFFRRFFLPSSSSCADAVFMRDAQNAYATYSWHVSPLGPFHLGDRVNTGLMLLHSSALNLELVETFLVAHAGGMAFRKKPQWIEQTCWSLLSQACESRQWDEAQVFLACSKTPPVTPTTIGIHFVSTFRTQLDHYLVKYGRREDEPLHLRAGPLVATNASALFWEEVRRRAMGMGLHPKSFSLGK